MGDMKSLQALFGGTFDPVHYGHLKPVETLANLIGLSRVIIMPNNVRRIASRKPPAQRKYMLELAIADKPLLRWMNASYSEMRPLTLRKR